eukprot:142315-Pyramimonas_sp.AAC.1
MLVASCPPYAPPPPPSPRLLFGGGRGVEVRAWVCRCFNLAALAPAASPPCRRPLCGRSVRSGGTWTFSTSPASPC